MGKYSRVPQDASLILKSSSLILMCWVFKTPKNVKFLKTWFHFILKHTSNRLPLLFNEGKVMKTDVLLKKRRSQMELYSIAKGYIKWQLHANGQSQILHIHLNVCWLLKPHTKIDIMQYQLPIWDTYTFS